MSPTDVRSNPAHDNDPHGEACGRHIETVKPSFKALFAYTEREHVPELCCAILCSLISSVAKPVQAFLTGKVFDVFVKFALGLVTPDDLISQQRTWILYLVVVAGASWLVSALEFIFWIRFGDLQAQTARRQLYAGLAAADIAWYDTCEGGIDSLLPKLQSQTRDLQLATSQPLGIVLAAISTALASLGQAFYNSWNLTLVTLAGAPIIIVVIYVLSTLTQRAIQGQEGARVEIQAKVLEALANIDTVKCFNAQEFERKRYADGVARVAAWYMKIVQSNTWQLCILTFLVQSMFVQAFYYGGVLIRNGSKQASEVITIFFSAISAFLAIQGIVPQMVVIERGKQAGVALKAMVPNHSTTTQGGSVKPVKCLGGLEMRGVYFRYPARPDQLALDNVSLSLPAGSFTFLVGASGSGKSTIGQLLNGFYHADQGSILLDGEPISLLDVQWLRTRVLLVEQTSTLFSGTIEDNILLGRTRANGGKHALSFAVEFALLQDMLYDMPDGVNTELGYVGQSISGGQRQRLALARARLIDPPVLILDESTSALDQVTRELILATIRRWRWGRTTIIITHDLTQITATDQLIVLAAGRIVQQGTRNELERVRASAFSSLLLSSQVEKQLPPDPPIGLLSPRASHQPCQGPMFWRSLSMYMDLTCYGNQYFLSVPDTSRRSVEPTGSVASIKVIPQLDLAQQRRSTMKQTLQDIGRPVTDKHKSIVAGHALDSGLHSHPLAQNSLFQMSRLLWKASKSTSRAQLVGGIIAGGIHAVCLPTFSYILAKLLALYAEPGDTSSQSIRYSIAILGVAAGDALSTYLYRSLMEQASQAWVDALRRQAVHRLFEQPQDFFDNDQDTAGALAETLDDHAEEMRNLFGRFIIMLWIAAAILAISIVWAMTSEWKLTLLCITAAPCIYMAAQAFTRVSEHWERRSLEAWHQVNLVFGESFGKVRTVRSLAIEEHFSSKYATANDHLLQVGWQRGFWTGVFYGLSSSAEHFATAFVFFLGTKLAHDGSSIVSILQVFSILILSLANITGILGYVPQMSQAKVMAGRVLRLANLSGPSSATPENTHIGSVGPIVFRRLTFAYPSRPELTVLKNISLTLQPGATTAIVGGSGSGKSTIGKLLLKLCMPAGDASAPWQLKISGRDIRSISTTSVRAISSVVAQDAPLFNTTIAGNISYGLPVDSDYASMASITTAARQAGIYDFITSLPDGFSTIVGAKGVGLSGGQRQRIALARALVRRPALLILDEATSALDPQSSLLVRETIRQLVRQTDRRMTILMITHSRDMMACADQIVVLDQGRVAEVGTFPRLLQRRGHLAKLLNGGFVDE